MKLGRKELLLGVLLVVLVFVVGRQILTSTGVVGGPRAVVGGAVDVGEARAIIASLPSLALEDDRVAEAASYAPRRNIFEYATCLEDLRRQQETEERNRLLREARAKQEEQRTEQAKAEAAASRVAREEAGPRAPVAPSPGFDYVAYMGEVDQLGRPEIAVFEKGRGREVDILVARVGEVVDGDFVVRLIDWDRVELGYTDPQFSSQKKSLQLKGL